MRRTGTIVFALAVLLLVAAAQTHAQGSAPGPERQKLEAWVGDWILEGIGKDDPTSPEHRVVGSMQARWVLDGSFVQINHLWKSDGKESRFIEILGYDSTRRAYTSHMFRANGTVEVAEVSFKDRTYVIGGTTIGDDGTEVRWTCTWMLSVDGAPTSGKCEGEQAGTRWTSWVGTGLRAKAR